MAISREKILEIARSLPPLPRAFAELRQVSRGSETEHGLEDAAALIKSDSALASELLRVSDRVLGGRQRTGSIEEAVARVGLPEIFRLAGDVAIARLADRALTHYGIEAAALREHMLRSGFVCEQVALECGMDSRNAFTAAVMRPLGLLVLDRVAARHAHLQDYDPGRDGDYLAWEDRTFGVASCEVAAMVLSEWNFPAEIVESVRHQYLLRPADRAPPLACLVNLSGGAVADEGYALRGETRHWAPTPWKLDAVGLSAKSFQAAVARARSAYAEFLRRVRGEWPATGAGPPPAPVPDDGRRGAGAGEGQADAGSPGTISVDSCNFPPGIGVVDANDESPVQTTETGVSPAADFTTFMRNYQNMVFSTAARLTGNDAQAEDISQEVFLKAYEHYDQLSTSPTAGGWLKTVATNLSLNHLSRYRNRWRFFSELKRDADADDRDAPEVEFAAPDTFFASVDAADRRAIVDQALSELPEHQRVPLVLYHFEDMPYDDIAKKLRVSLAKVKIDILRARTALAKILTRSGTAHEKIGL